MAVEELDIWCSEVVNDGVTLTDNRRALLPEEVLNGWVRNGTVSVQQMNSLFYYLTTYSSPFSNSPYLMASSETTPDNAYDMDGSTFTEEDAPNLYEIYKGTLTDMSGDAPTGHKWVIRKS